MADDIREAADRVDAHLRALTAHPDRHVGGEGNRAATAHFSAAMSACGLDVRCVPMPCVEWVPGEATLEVGERLVANVGPYSLPCDLEAPLVPVATIEELEREQYRCG